MPLTLSHQFVFLFQDLCTLLREVRVQVAAELDVGLHLIQFERWRQCIILQSVHVHNVLCDVVILIIILVIKNEEEDVETGHDGRRDVHVEPKGL